MIPRVSYIWFAGLFLNFLIIQISFGQSGIINNFQDKYRVVHWSMDEGLGKERWHTAILKDVNGFMWFGTGYGELSRFDGFYFKQYVPDKNKPGSIRSNSCRSFIEDSLHNIWIGTNYGLSRYDIKADSFTNFNSVTGNTIQHDIAFPFWATANEIFCFETDSLVSSYNIHSFKRTIRLNIKALDPGRVNLSGATIPYTIFDSASNSIWMLPANEEGLVQISLKTGKLTNYFRPVYKISRSNFHHKDAEAMCYDRNRNCIWINSHDGLIQFTLSDQRFHHVDALNPFVNQKDYDRWVGIDIDKKGRIWLATFPKGIIVYDPNSQSVTNPLTDSLQKEVEIGNLKIYCDRDGMVWTSYWAAKGIYQLIPYSPSVHRYVADAGKPGSLNSCNIQNIVPGEHGSLWIGTFDKGLNIFNPETDAFKVLREKDLPGIKGEGIVPLFIDTLRNKAWLYTHPSEMIYEMNMATKKCKSLIFKDTANYNIIPVDINGSICYPYKNGFLFPEGGHGIFEVAGSDQVARLVIPRAGIPVSRMTIGEDNKLFLHPDNSTYSNINGAWIKTPGPMDSIPWSDIYFDKKDHTYWLGVYNELIHYDKNFRKLRTYTDEEGLIGEPLTILPDELGNIWFNNDRKIIGILNIKTGTVSSLSEADGYKKQSFDWTSPQAKAAGGELYFPGNPLGSGEIGLDRISPEKFINNAAPSLVYIKSLEINQKDFSLSTGANNLQELSLRYYENSITIETGIIDFYSKGKSSIRYKLERINDDWHYAPANYTIRYDGLPPGNYKLVMQSSNAGNEFNGPVKSLLLHISPPFWKSWWFNSLIVIIILIAINVLFQFRLNQKMQVLKVRQRLHRDLHDDVGATLSTVKIYSEILQKNPDNTLITELIKTNAADMIDKLEIIAWATNPQHDTFKSFKEVINKYASAICYAKNIELNLEYDGVNENMIMPGDIRQNLFLIFKEAINNVIKYSEASKCNVQIDVKHHKFSFTITDNGKGFRGITKGNGSGWKNMQKRCEEINGKVTIESKDGQGTIISISLPYPFKIPSFWDRKRNIL